MRAFVVGLLLAAAATGSEPLERAVFLHVNEWRASHSLPALRWSESAAVLARQHSRAIASGRRRMGHDGFQDRVARLRAAAPVSAAAENIAAFNGIRDVAASTVKGWAASLSHRKNMSERFTETGVGAAVARDGTVYVTQLYLTPAPRKPLDRDY